MKLQSARLREFTVFADTSFEFCPGVNVFIGENGTGKSHVLKVIYAVLSALRKSEGGSDIGIYMDELRNLDQVFLPDGGRRARLLRRGGPAKEASIQLQLDSGGPIELTLDSAGGLQCQSPAPPLPEALPRSIFLPPREAISIYPGFISAWQERESAFDRTYFDLCVALGERPLRQMTEKSRGLLAPLEQILGGKVLFKNEHFYVDLPDGTLEMPLFAEGLRKIATIAYLLINGSLRPGCFLFWDEPEANMNPRLVLMLKRLLLGFSAAGIQSFIATHDFLLADELSLSSRYEGQSDRIRFLALTKDGGAVQVESAADLGELVHNPIMAEFAAHYDREVLMIDAATQGA
jgi:energy-coupling factor transporter ATP-binding protein EcfA2